MDTIAAICNVPMILSGNKRMATGKMVKITDHTGKPITPVTIAAISVMI